jgi:hypothetical protein
MILPITTVLQRVHPLIPITILLLCVNYDPFPTTANMLLTPVDRCVIGVILMNYLQLIIAIVGDVVVDKFILNLWPFYIVFYIIVGGVAIIGVELVDVGGVIMMIELKLVLLVWPWGVVLDGVVDHELGCSFYLLGLVDDVAVVVDDVAVVVDDVAVVVNLTVVVVDVGDEVLYPVHWDSRGLLLVIDSGLELCVAAIVSVIVIVIIKLMMLLHI